jgi:hypothetical protein
MVMREWTKAIIYAREYGYDAYLLIIVEPNLLRYRAAL